MWHLYLDESGDLGFDFLNAQPSNFFTIAVVAVRGDAADKQIRLAVRRTLKHKLHASRKLNRRILELKGSSTTREVKAYFYRSVQSSDFHVYALTVDKKKSFQRLAAEKIRLYDYMTHRILERIPLEDAQEKVTLIIDDSMTRAEKRDFDESIIRQLHARLDPKVRLKIYHQRSHETPGLQAADLYAWGIFRKYEKQDVTWFDVFHGKVKNEEFFLLK